MTKYMQYWEKMARPPISALKTIKGGRLSGMSNISPQWRWKIMTETFGPIGFGWKYTIEKTWTSPGANDEQFAFSSILLYYKTEEGWSEPIPGEGGSMLISKEAKGMHNNDEAFKMAVTDALGTAMSKIGVGADIYLGTFDGSKYNETSGFPKQIDSNTDAVEAMSSLDIRKPVKATQEPLGATEQPESENGTEKPAEAATEAKYSVSELRSAEIVVALKGVTGKQIPELMKVINGLDKNGKYSVEEVAKLVE